MSKKQLIGLGILVLMVAAVELCVYLTDRWLDRHPAPELLELRPEREQAFLCYLDSLDQADYAARRAQYGSRYERPSVRLQPFDPNTADSALLVTVGLKPWMAHNLIRYRSAGKVFRQKDDLRSLYGMNDSLYSTLEPYIQLDTAVIGSLSGHSRAVTDSTLVVNTTFRATHPKRDTVLELNTADTAELQLLRGVGLYTAIRIVRYRQALGGYYSTDQLYEIRELPTQRVDSLLPWLVADTTLIEPVDVNSASVKQLQRHPYVSYRQAELIYDLRRRRVRLRSIHELSGIFTPDELQRLTPYLRFSEQ